MHIFGHFYIYIYCTIVYFPSENSRRVLKEKTCVNIYHIVIFRQSKGFLTIMVKLSKNENWREKEQKCINCKV